VIPEVQQFVPWVVCLGLLVASVRVDGLFCGLETGIYLMNKNRLDLHAETGNRAAVFLQRILRTPEEFLGTLLIGTNIMRYLSTFSISTMFVLGGYERSAEWLTLAVAAPLLFVASDSVPKTVFQRLSEQSVYRLTWVLRSARAAFRATGLLGLVIVISKTLMKLTAVRTRTALGHEGVAAVLAEGRASGVLTQFQSAMADRVMNLSDVSVADAMVPMRHVASVPDGTESSELMETISRYNYSRLPVLDPRGKVVGILNVYDILTDPEASVSEKITNPIVIPGDMSITEGLYTMRRGRSAMAIVRSDDRHVGIVTIKDLVEEIVGELEAW